MKINSDTNGSGGASRGSISRSYAGVEKNPSVYSYFERLFHPTVRGRGLSIRRSAASVQGLHNAAVNGDTITLPAGTFTWSTPVAISKAINLRGQGSGRIIGNTKSSATVGTGAKTFTRPKAGYR
jgi:hypothetical protein